jgi:hypothetical protein
MHLAIHHDFAKDGAVTGRQGPPVGYTRSGTGGVYINGGWWREVGTDIPRMQGGIVIENRVLLSEINSLDDTAPELGVTIDTDVETPIGTVNLIKASDNSAESSYAYNWGGPPAVVVGREYLVSAYVRLSDGTEPELAYTSGSSGNFCFILGNINVDPATRKVTPVKGWPGWYRVSGAYKASSGSTGFIQYAGQKNYGGRTDVGMQITGFQIEEIGGAWRRMNLLYPSEDYETLWNQNNVTVEYGIDDPQGGNTAIRTTNVTAVGRLERGIAGSVYSGAEIIHSVWLRRVGGYTGLVQLFTSELAFTNVSDQVTDEWSRVEVTTTLGVTLYLYTSVSGIGAQLDIWHPQLELKKPDQIKASEYVYTDSSGAVIDYSPGNYQKTTGSAVAQMTGPCEGLRLDPTRTNLLLWSNDLTQTAWTKTSAVATTDVVLAPNGSFSGNRLIDNNDTLNGPVAVFQNVTVNSGLSTFGFSVKKDLVDWCAVETLGFDAGGNGLTYVDVANQVPGGIVSGNHDLVIKDLGNGWARVSVGFTTTTDLAGQVWVYLAEANGDRLLDRNNDKSLFLADFQLEFGRRPSMPIYTEGVSLSRNFDNGNTGATTEIANMEEVTTYLHIEFEQSSSAAVSIGLDGPLSETIDGCIGFYSQGLNFRHVLRDPGIPVNEFSIIDSTIEDGDEYRCAQNVAKGRTHFYIDGVQTLDNANDFTGALGNGVDRFIIIGSIGSCVLKEYRAYMGSLSDEQTRRMTDASPIFPGYDPGKKRKAIDAALWNKAMNQRTKEADSDGDYTPFNNVG